MYSLLFAWLALAAEFDAASLLAAADAPRQAFFQSIVQVRAVTEEAGRPDKVAEFELFIADDDRQLVVFRDEKNKGRKVVVRADKSWLIVPGAARPVAVTTHHRLAGGASFTDIGRLRLARDYSGSLRGDFEPCGDPPLPCRVVELNAVSDKALYASGTVWIDGDGLARNARLNLASGKPARELRFDYRLVNGSPVPKRVEIRDLLAGERSLATTLHYLSHRKTPLSDDLFDPDTQAAPVSAE